MNKRYSRVLAIISSFFMISFIPLIYLGFFNHPSADDYSYGKFTHRAWVETQSLWEVLKAAYGTSVHFWKECDGLYASAFFMSLQPAIFGEKYYTLVIFITMGSLLFANLFFSYIVLHKLLELCRREWLYAGLLSAFMMIQWMPSGCQGLYWYDGSMNYTCFFAIFMIMISMSLYALTIEETRKKTFFTLIISLLAIILAGGNHVTAFAGIMYLAGGTIYSILSKKKHMFSSMIFPLIAISGGFIFNMTSPGTAARQGAFTERYGVIKTIMWASIRGCEYINEWFGLHTVFCVFLLLPVIYKIVKLLIQRNFTFRYPLVIIILSIGFTCALLAPPYYAMGLPGEGRLTNVIYYTYVALLLFNVVYVLGWLKVRLNVDLFEKMSNYKLFNNLYVPMILCVAIICFGGLDSNGYIAVKDIVSGDAAVYSRENYERIEFLENTEYDEVFVTPFTVCPELLYFDDITYDICDWRNCAMAYYFNLDTIQKYDYMGEALW